MGSGIAAAHPLSNGTRRSLKAFIRETLWAMHMETNQSRDNSASSDNGFDLRTVRLPPVDYKALKQIISIHAVLEELEFKPVSRQGSKLRGPCPVHRSTNERSRSFSVDLTKNVYRCFSPSCGSQGNQLDLFAAAMKLPLLSAAHELCSRLGITPPRLHPQGNQPPPRQQRRGTRTSE